MALVAMWLFVLFAALVSVWAHRQNKDAKALRERLAASEARTEQLAGYVQRALEDVYVLSVLMAERGHLDPDEIEKGRERLIKNAKTQKPAPEARASRGTVH